MDSLWIEGGRRLEGKVVIPPAKNASLPLLCLSLLTDQAVRFDSLPNVADVQSMTKLLQALGVERQADGSFRCFKILSVTAPYEWVRKMRASILVLGPLMAREHRAEVSLPGGCAIGERPVDIHLKGLEALGARIEIEGGYIKASLKNASEGLRGARFVLDFPTVTGTINLVTAAVLARGETCFENVAREPEVVEVCAALSAMGARIEGAGTSTIRIQGVERLEGLTWQIQPDRIQLLTYLAAGAVTKGRVECTPYRRGSIDSVIQKFEEMGCEIHEGSNSIEIRSQSSLKPIHLETSPFPGFPTDAQAQFCACLSTAQGSEGPSVVKETVFENRFQHISELRRMGARIDLEGNTAIISGVSNLSGAAVMASDLRASACLVLAGLAAREQTQVLRVYHLDRGYEGLEEKLNALGARVWRKPQ